MGADVRLIGSLMVRHTVYIIKCLFCFLLFFWRRLLATVRGFCVQFGSAFSFATDKMFQPPPPPHTRCSDWHRDVKSPSQWASFMWESKSIAENEKGIKKTIDLLHSVGIIIVVLISPSRTFFPSKIWVRLSRAMSEYVLMGHPGGCGWVGCGGSSRVTSEEKRIMVNRLMAERR
jgi:hypothetical protein